MLWKPAARWSHRRVSIRCHLRTTDSRHEAESLQWRPRSSANRRGGYEHTSFTSLGYTTRTRSARNKYGRMFASFLRAVSRDALVAMARQVCRWRIRLRTSGSLADPARWMNPIVRARCSCYGAFNCSEFYPLLRRINTYLVP